MVVGGGIVGVELAAELAKAASRAPRRITLVHGGARLMDDLPASAGERAAKWLRRHGVNVLVGERYVSVPNDSKTIKIANTYRGVHSGTTITPDEVIVATGARPATEFLSESEVSDDVNPEHIKVPLDGSGRIRVDPKTFRVDCKFCGTLADDGSSEQQPEIYAIGDCVAKPADQYLASYAHWEAEYVASRILRGAVVGSYKCPPRLICVSFGPNDGLIIWGDRILCGGFLAAVFKLIIEFWFKNFLPAPYSIFRHLPMLREKLPSKEK
jgi:NADH dehydrogenase FAD-containing subunit